MRNRRFTTGLALVLALLAAVVLLARSELLPSPRSALDGQSELLLAVLDVGQGDSILVRSPSGRTMLVDAGNSARDTREVILPYMQRHAIQELDLLVLTHPDQDHVGGMPALLESVPVGRFLDSAQATTNRAYQRTLELALEKNVPSERVRRSRTTLDLGPEVRAQVLGPEDPLLKSGDSPENNNSVAIRIEYGRNAALLTGDLEQEAEERILATGDELRSQILKVAHHGSGGSSTQAFLDAVRPEIAIISAGENNRYGHPHPQALERLRRHTASIYRTDRQGTITVRIFPDRYVVETER